MEVNHFFSSFILTDNKYEENIDGLLKEFTSGARKTVDLVRSNNGGWHSPTDIFKKPQLALEGSASS